MIFSKHNIFLTVIFLITNYCLCQRSKIDSLKSTLSSASNDSTRLSTRCEIGKVSGITRISFWDSIATDAKKMNLKSVLAYSLKRIGRIHKNQGNFSEALEFYNRSLQISESINDMKSMANLLTTIGIAYDDQGYIEKAFEYYDRSLKISEKLLSKTVNKAEIKDLQNEVGYALGNIGILYKDQQDYGKAVENFQKCLKMFEITGNVSGQATAFQNLAKIYNAKDDIEKALDYYRRALKMYEQDNEKQGVATALNSIGTIYNKKGDLASALEFFQKSLSARKKIDDIQGMPYTYNNISNIYFGKNNFVMAGVYADSAAKIAINLGFPDAIKNCEQVLYRIDSARGNFKSAFEHHKNYVLFKDSISNANTRKASMRNQIRFEFEKREVLLKEQQENERGIANERNRRQKLTIVFFGIGFILVIIFSFFIFKSWKKTRTQKKIIEEKQKDILDSIRYAKRIQNSLLPNEKYIDRIINQAQKTK